MIVLKFEKFGTLFQYNGVPVYMDGRLITRKWMCWWWPVNWIAAALLTPVILWRLIVRMPK